MWVVVEYAMNILNSSLKYRLEHETLSLLVH